MGKRSDGVRHKYLVTARERPVFSAEVEGKNAKEAKSVVENYISSGTDAWKSLGVIFKVKLLKE